VIPDDIKTLAPYVLGHRIVPDGALPGEGSFTERENLVRELTDTIDVPL
jgi:hypothetical protein